MSTMVYVKNDHEKHHYPLGLPRLRISALARPLPRDRTDHARRLASGARPLVLPSSATEGAAVKLARFTKGALLAASAVGVVLLEGCASTAGLSTTAVARSGN